MNKADPEDDPNIQEMKRIIDEEERKHQQRQQTRHQVIQEIRQFLARSKGQKESTGGRA